MTQPLKALVGARVSVVQGPQKVSHIAQQETGAKWVAEHGHTIVGTFQDLDVSATVSPFERPDLGPWLTEEKSHQWDILVFSKIDRMFRSTRDCVRFAEWAEQHGKVLVFAEDSMTLNYRDKGQSGSLESMMAELFIYIGSFFAQLELNRFKSRARDGHRVLRGTDRWASGVPPLGFKVVDHPSGKGKGLATDDEGKALLYEMAGKLLEGWSFIRIADWCNESGALTNMDRARVAKGQEPKQRPWTVGTVTDALTLPKTQGFKMHKRQTVLDDKGEMIRLGPPTFDDDTWNHIQKAAAKRKRQPRSKTHSSNPMLGVGFCGQCGASLAQQFSKSKSKSEDKTHRYYRCGRTPVNCRNTLLQADIGDQLLEESFVDQWGSQPVKRRIFVPGEDHTHELERIRATIERLRRESDEGLIVGADEEERYFTRMRSLVTRRVELESTPMREAGWITEETGQTYGEVWNDGETDRRQLLADAGIRFVLEQSKPYLKFHLEVPQDRVPIKTQ
ncbi:hypothetical protein N806_31130 [Rhodococcus sp. P27]|nr:hypothetical protein N806_31130 [Rhodococcus sp. P27]